MDTGALWPLAVYFGAVLVVVTGMVVLSYLLGQRRRSEVKGKPYESGVAQTGTARLRFDVQFYLNAVFFVIFDIEAAFIFAYAVAFRELGWFGYTAILIFIGTLVVGLAYLWRQGALEWGGTRRGRMR